MHFIILVSLLSANKIINKKICHILFFKDYIHLIHDSFVEKFISDIEQRKISLENHICKKNPSWKDTTYRDALFDTLYDITFSNIFIKRMSYILNLYENFFLCLKLELFKKLNEVQNIENLTNPEYIALFCDTFVIYFKNTIKMLTEEDYICWEIDLLTKHFSKQKINLKSAQDTATIDFKDLNQVNFLKNLLRENMISKTIDLIIFLDVNKFIDQLNEFIAENKIDNEQKIFIFDFNSDFIFLICFYMETKKYDLQFLNDVFSTVMKKIHENISLVKKQNLKTKIDEIKVKSNVIFQVSQLRSDFINIYFEFIRDLDDEDTKNFKLDELTNMIFDIQKEIQLFLHELFDKSESIGQDMEFEVGE